MAFDRDDYTSDFIEECKRQIEHRLNRLQELDREITELQRQERLANDELNWWDSNLENEYKAIEASELVAGETR